MGGGAWPKQHKLSQRNLNSERIRQHGDSMVTIDPRGNTGTTLILFSTAIATSSEVDRSLPGSTEIVAIECSVKIAGVRVARREAVRNWCAVAFD